MSAAPSLACLLLVIVCSVLGDVEDVIFFIGDSAEFPCPVAPADGVGVKWVDLVYNQGPDPQVIALNGAIDQNHPHKENYEITADSTLRILQVSKDDVGEYRCSYQVNETATVQHRYYLMSLGRPSCTGETTVIAGSTANLICEAPFSGKLFPSLNWYDPEIGKLNSTDQFDIQLAKMKLSLSATAAMNTKQFDCRVTLGDKEAQCSMTLDVQYPVHKITVDPIQESYPVGEPIKCSADGNPAPKVTWSPSSAVTSEGSGWSTVVPDPSLEGTTTTYTCSAKNVIGEEIHLLTTNITFKATEPLKKPTQPEPEPGPSSKNAGANIAPIVGAIIGIIVFIVIISAIVIVVKRKSSKKPKGAKPVPTHDIDAKKMNDQKGGGYYGDSVRYSGLNDKHSSPKFKSDYKKKDKGWEAADLNRNTEESPLPWRKQTGATYSDPRRV